MLTAASPVSWRRGESSLTHGWIHSAEDKHYVVRLRDDALRRIRKKHVIPRCAPAFLCGDRVEVVASNAGRAHGPGTVLAPVVGSLCLKVRFDDGHQEEFLDVELRCAGDAVQESTTQVVHVGRPSDETPFPVDVIVRQQLEKAGLTSNGRFVSEDIFGFARKCHKKYGPGCALLHYRSTQATRELEPSSGWLLQFMASGLTSADTPLTFQCCMAEINAGSRSDRVFNDMFVYFGEGHPMWKEYVVDAVQERVRNYNPATDVVLCFTAHYEKGGADFWSHPLLLHNDGSLARWIGSTSCSRKYFQRGYPGLCHTLREGDPQYEHDLAKQALSSARQPSGERCSDAQGIVSTIIPAGILELVPPEDKAFMTDLREDLLCKAAAVFADSAFLDTCRSMPRGHFKEFTESRLGFLDDALGSIHDRIGQEEHEALLRRCIGERDSRGSEAAGLRVVENCATNIRAITAKCAGCGSDDAPSLKPCSGCKMAFYCGRECQRADWKARHKRECVQLQEQMKRECENKYKDIVFG